MTLSDMGFVMLYLIWGLRGVLMVSKGYVPTT